jgi:hypothetical protein
VAVGRRDVDGGIGIGGRGYGVGVWNRKDGCGEGEESVEGSEHLESY